MSRAAKAFTALDAVPAHVAVLDTIGTVVFTNRAWRLFGEENGMVGDSVGTDYLAVCDAAASPAADGIRSVLAGRHDEFAFEYPCHSATEGRWFSMRASVFEHDGARYVLVLHIDITDRKHAELQAAEQIEHLERVTTVLTDQLRAPVERIARVLAPRADEEDVGSVLLALAKMGAILDEAVTLAEEPPADD